MPRAGRGRAMDLIRKASPSRQGWIREEFVSRTQNLVILSCWGKEGRAENPGGACGMGLL